MSPKTRPQPQTIDTLNGLVLAWCRRNLISFAISERDAFLSRAVDHCDLESRIRELERSHANAGLSRSFVRF